MATKRKPGKTIEELERVDIKKTQFFMAASHQLKSPVAIIQWCLQSALESKTLDNKNQELIRKSLVQANSISALISDMLHVFRLVNRQSWQNEFKRLDPGAIIREVVSQYEEIAHNKDVHLVKGPMENVPGVLGDESYLRQAIINLVDNAIKYSLPGSTVTVSACLTKDGYVELCVKDQGIGIAEIDQRNLFTEFFRSEEARGVTHEGTGLGLVLVKQIAEEFGGEVVVKSALRKGSTFIIRLPSAG